jgi:hypothetical protein
MVRHSNSSETVWHGATGGHPGGANGGHPGVAESWAPPADANLKRPESKCGTWLPSSTSLAVVAATVVAARFADSPFGTGSGSWLGNLKT